MIKRIKALIQKREPAYFTLEASLVFPMVLIISVILIFLAFYAYDRCMLEHSAYEAALIGTSNHLSKAEDALAESKKAAAVLVGERLFAINKLTYDVSADADSVSVTFNAGINMPFIKSFSESDFDLDITKSSSRLKPAVTIRTCRTINKLIKERKE